ncbi:MAG: SulP family inorganic anion transporter, partial [Coriobacteriales bacterium]
VMLGALPTALPRMRLPSFAGVDVARALFGGFTVAVVSAIESLLTVNLFALRHDWLGGEDHELLSFGIVNAVVALCGCPTCSASLSRSAAGEAAGGRTQLASVVASVTVVGAVLLFSPALAYLPQPALAAVVVDALACVVDVRKIARYARRMHSEFLVFVLTALVVALIGAIVGVAFGIALSLALLWCRSHSTRHEKLMGVVSPETVLDGIEIPRDTMVYRFSGMLSFLNIAPLVASLVSAIESDTRVVIIDLSAVVELDTTSTDRLVSAIESLQARGLQVRVVRGLTPSRDHYTRFELEHIFHRAQVYPTVASAIAIVPQELQEVVQVEPEDLQDGASG